MKETGKQVRPYNLLMRLVGERPGMVLGAFFLSGMLLGWMVLGWWVFPVRWKDAGPAQLHSDFQREWVQMTSDSFIITTDVELARMRLGWLDDHAVKMVEEARENTEGPDQLRISQLQIAIGEQIGSVEASREDSSAKEMVLEGQTVDGDAERESYFASPDAVLPALLGGLVVVAIMGLGGFFLVRYAGSRSTKRESSLSYTEGISENVLSGDESGTSIAVAVDAEERGEPVSRFMTTYLLGDDLYDDSFSIDDANGDFLGECGMGVSDTIGVGDPKKVCAFEIWLFDKNDVRTVTKVLMSEDAFGDDEKRIALEPKGETMMAKTGSEIILDTASLHVAARVVDMQYGTGALPNNSFFHQLTIELAAWKKT